MKRKTQVMTLVVIVVCAGVIMLEHKQIQGDWANICQANVETHNAEIVAGHLAQSIDNFCSTGNRDSVLVSLLSWDSTLNQTNREYGMLNPKEFARMRVHVLGIHSLFSDASHHDRNALAGISDLFRDDSQMLKEARIDQLMGCHEWKYSITRVLGLYLFHGYRG